MSLRQTLRGTGVALVTPFNASGKIDFFALETLINYVIKNGVEYVVSLGTTGETPTLSKEEKIDILQFTYEKVDGRVPVVAGVGGNNTQELIHDLHHYPLEKATAILSASPYYNKPSQEGIFLHYKALAEASPKPIILYNVPGRTGRNMEAATTLRLAHEVPNIGGIKEAANNMVQCMQILKDRPEHFLVVSGDDDLVMPQMSCGMDGVISVAANCLPRKFTDMVRAGLAFDFGKAKEINDTLLEAYYLLFAENNPSGVKAFLSELGLIENNLRLPMVPLSESLREKVVAYLRN
ncbi:4-hydroxy-tetrahydrodipicolinate synthase [Flavihumibacter petaseus]|uniref:4-hydroxy-tetrahydrodipicolinate synthase n=1 Tax=Flavihumibacter petaseus NBRC 106054 TaxID=1220578 RepID=A0A0E9N2X7_9BACT|nr:4-hydroxy-tetrahydrodipicolinate synthase [Flavihumibacter petaseus]GAO44138.1 dihydrodipicolinate synthase [Flavihumibacter petaseus NBRC 106054]